MAEGDVIMDSPRKRVAYDPDQDPEEKRVLRQKYRVLLKDEEGKACTLDRCHRSGAGNLLVSSLPFRLGHQINANEYTTQELLEKVQLADSLFDQGVCIFPWIIPSYPLFLNSVSQCPRLRKRRSTLRSS
jgi:hypothetical protein